MKHLSLLILLVLAVTGLSAQTEETKEAMVVETKGGERVEFYFDQKPVMTFLSEDVSIASDDKTVQYPMSDVKRVFFDKIATGLSKTEAESVRFFFDGDMLRAEGLKPQSVLAVYTVGGSLVAKTVTASDGTARQSTAALQKGMYIVKADKVTYKFLKK